MPESGGALAHLLVELKKRSGLSYSELGRKAHLSSSTLHRYCSGATVPPDYHTVVGIATACEATDAELVELLRCWRLATGQVVVEEPPAQVAVRTRGRVVSGIAAALVLVLALAALTASGQGAAPDVAQRIDGPSWLREEPLDPSLFGVTASSSSGSMPTFTVGSLRFWDSRTRWASLQPRPDEYDWTVLDRLVDGASKSDLPATLVFGGTPAWAAPDGPKAPYGDGSRSAPPDDLAAWERFVNALVTRYRGRIDAYEVWVHANDRRYYSGSVETLVEMTTSANRAIKAVDPEATVVCPSIDRIWTDEGRAVLNRFAELRGYDHCDVAGVNLHQRRASDPPEVMVDLLRQISGALHDAGVHPPLWNTGVTYEYVRDDPLDERRAIAFAVRFYLVTIYGSNFGLQRAYFYNWGSGELPIALQAVGGPPTRAALAVQELQRWLDGATTHGCGHGRAIDLPSNVWQCEFTARDGRPLVVRWTSGGAATTSVTRPVDEIRHLDGTTSPLRDGDAVDVSETPILIVHQR